MEKEGKYGLVNMEGTEIVPCVYDRIGDFSEDGIAEAEKDNRNGLVDIKGNTTFD